MSSNKEKTAARKAYFEEKGIEFLKERFNQKRLSNDDINWAILTPKI